MNLIQSFPKRLDMFIKTAHENQLNMILIGGGAVNFHGYQRHSADIDFWIEITEINLSKLLLTLQQMGYQIEELPEEVKKGAQNISIKISPVLELELITSFNPGKSFGEAYKESIPVNKGEYNYRVLSFDDLIASKISTDRAKDKTDVEELHKIRLRKKH